MALPKLENPTYEVELPSNNNKIKYRPFLVKEQKLLMLAQESEDQKEIVQAMASLINSCTFGEIDATTLLTVADVHFQNGLIIQVGPGFERKGDHDVFVGRVGTLYEFEVENYTVSPQLHWDYHDGEANAIVAGIAFGFSFLTKSSISKSQEGGNLNLGLS